MAAHGKLKLPAGETVALSCWLLRHWLSARARRLFPEFFAYGFAAAGLFYATQMYKKGSL